METEIIQCVHSANSLLYFCMDSKCNGFTQKPTCPNCFLEYHDHDTIILRRLTQDEMLNFNLEPLKKKKRELIEVIKAKYQKLRELFLQKIEKKQNEQYAKLNSILSDDIRLQSNEHINFQNNGQKHHQNSRSKSIQSITANLNDYEKQINNTKIKQEFQQLIGANERRKSGNYKRVKISKPIPQEIEELSTYPVFKENINTNIIEIEYEGLKQTVDDFEKAQSFIKIHAQQKEITLTVDLTNNQNPRKNLTSFLNSLRILTKIQSLQIFITKQCKIGEWNLTEIDDILNQLVMLKQFKLSYSPLTLQAMTYRYIKCSKIGKKLGNKLILNAIEEKD